LDTVDSYKYLLVKFRGGSKLYAFIDELECGAEIGDVIVFLNSANNLERFGLVDRIKIIPKGLLESMYPYPPNKTVRITRILKRVDADIWKIDNGFL